MKKATKILLTLAIVPSLGLLSACGGSGGSEAITTPNIGTASSCPQQITAGANVGITTLPSAAGTQYTNNFCKYTKLVAPNGGAIHFYAQNLISNEQLIRARRILATYLENLPASQYGLDKSAVFNSMADNNATLIMSNGSDTGSALADGQTLFQTENIIEGSPQYFSGEPRDAAYEEILHLMHDTGIGVDGANGGSGVLISSYQMEIRDAMQDAIAPGVIASGLGTQSGLWASIDTDWLRELRDENSLTQEYLASLIDTYYGLTGKASPGGSYDLYTPQTREDIQTMDAKGWALVGGSNPRKYFSEYVTRMVRMDESYSGTFEMALNPSQPYTYKSRFLLNIQLLGSNNANINGNEQANIFGSNAGNNIFDGRGGVDTVKYSGLISEYTISIESNGDRTIIDNVSGRDGTDTLKNIEQLQFTDGLHIL